VKRTFVGAPVCHSCALAWRPPLVFCASSADWPKCGWRAKEDRQHQRYEPLAFQERACLVALWLRGQRETAPVRERNWNDARSKSWY
jgi:hypothetical protein